MDLLEYVKHLESTGLSRKHAETHVNVIRHIMGDSMASKQDLKELDISMREQLYKTETSLNLKISSVEEKLGARIDSVEEKLGARIDSVEESIKNLEKNLEKKFNESIINLGSFLEARIENKIWQKIFFSALGTALIMQALGFLLQHYLR